MCLYRWRRFCNCISTHIHRRYDNPAGEGNASDGRPGLQQQQQHLLVQPELFTALYFENFGLHTNSVDADIQAAGEGFGALARTRRGTPWPGVDDGSTDAESWAEGKRGGRKDDGGSGGSGDSEEDNGNDVSGALETFFEQYEGHVQEFASRSASNFADANNRVSRRLVEKHGRGFVVAKEISAP